MKQEMLSSSSSSGSDSGHESEHEEIHKLTINEHFAKAYEYRKEREELQKLKEKYGSDYEEGDEEALDDDEDDSESDESEDEDGEELTPAVDAAILRTLARIRRKDPEIYESGREVFTEEHGKSGKLATTAPKPKEKASKPLTLPAHRLASMLETSRSPSPSNDSDSSSAPQPLTHIEEQARLRAETISAFHADPSQKADAEEDEDEEEGGLFTLRAKTQDEVRREEEEYRQYLERELRQGGVEGLEVLKGLVDVENVEGGVKGEQNEEEGERKKNKKGKKERQEEKTKVGKEGRKGKEENDQEFLMNYILNRGWIDRSAKRLPTFDEITFTKPSKSKSKSKASAKTENGDNEEAEDESDAEDTNENNLIEDEDEFEDVVDVFESSYNFRFEEPDAPHIPSFPRNVDTVRRPAPHTERRKEARERRRERKEEELKEKREDVKRLKGLKMKEMKKKLEMIGKEGGWRGAQALEKLDLEGDWDSAAYDAQMQAILAEVEGNMDESADVDDDKPTWDDDIDVGDIMPPSDNDEPEASPSQRETDKKKKKKKKKGTGGEDVDGGVDTDEMDAERMDVAGGDGAGGWDEEEWDGTEEMRKRVLDKYMDEMLGLEFNDVVAGQPTRFKYTTVAPSTYALTPAEILLASDKDLNEYMGIKMYAPYRKEKERWDHKRGERLKEFKTKVKAKVPNADDAGMIFGGGHDGGERKEKKRKGKKERMKEKAAKDEGIVDMEEGKGENKRENVAVNSEGKSHKKEGKRKRGEEEEAAVHADASGHVGGDSEQTKKKRRRHKRSGKGDGVEVDVS